MTSTRWPRSVSLVTTACVHPVPHFSPTLTGFKFISSHILAFCSCCSGWHLLACHPSVTLSLLLLKKGKNKSEGMTNQSKVTGTPELCTALCFSSQKSFSQLHIPTPVLVLTLSLFFCSLQSVLSSPHFWRRFLLKWPSTIAAAASRKVEKVTSILVHGERRAQTVASLLFLLLRV